MRTTSADARMIPSPDRQPGVRRFVLLLLGAWIALVVSQPSRAQSFFGSIVGTVIDPSGATVAGASVAVINLGTNERREAQSDAAGNYRIPNLVPATYRMEVERSGFKRFARQPVEVRVESDTRIDVPMEVGAVTETVQVTTETPLLQTDSGTVSDAVEGERVQEMPLNGRNTMNLVALTPGVVSGTTSGASALNMGTHTGNSTWSDYSIGGGYAGGSAMYIDGATDNLLGNPIAFIPTQDSVQEFQIVSSGASPEFGRFGGGVINMTTKSGTNQFHGSVYEYFRNRALNANNFFNNRTGQSRPEWNQNQFGVTFGSPLLRDKLFSFFSWEGFRLLLGVPATIGVPTQAMRNGTFTTAITDPLAEQNGRTGCVTHPQAGTWQIASACIDPTAAAMLSYWPLPNQTNAPVQSNWSVTPVTGNNANQFTERVDYNLSDKQRLFARYTYWGQVDVPYNELENFTTNSYSHNRSMQAVLGDTYSLNPTTIADVRLAYDRQYTDNQPYTLDRDLSFLGPAWATLQTQLNPRYYPGPHVLGSYNLYPFFGMDVDSYGYYNDYDLTASVTKIKGNHSLKFGGEIRLSDESGISTTLDGGGSFLFLGLYSGDPFADFLFGVPATGTVQKLSPVASYNWYQAFYAADTWQVSRKLTVNYGLRWELPGSIAERNNKDTVLLPNTLDPATGIEGTVALTDSSMYSSRYVSDRRLNLFSPRLGFAYRLNPSVVFRGGYTLTYYPPDLPAGVLAQNSPVNTATTGFANNIGGPYTVLSNPFPAGIISPVGRNVTTGFRQSLLGQTLSGPVPHQPYPWAQQWNLGIGYQFPHNMMVEGNYLGSASQSLPSNAFGLDELPSQDWSAAGAVQSNRPYGANYLNVINTAANIGVANYQAGILKVEKRFGSGGVVSGNYTFSKSLADVESPAAASNSNGASSEPNTGNNFTYAPQTFMNYRANEYSLSSFDVRHRVVVSYVLDLPFGEGKRYAQFHGFAGDLVSGWAVNGITSFQKGFPLYITQSGNALTTSFGAGQLRPNYNPGCNVHLPGAGKDRLNEWFNTTCYQAVGNYSLGNEPRVDPHARADGIDNWDISLLKSTKVRQNLQLQFRAEFFNSFNHPQFAAPQSEIDGGNFGVVTAQQNSPRLIQFSFRVNF